MRRPEMVCLLITAVTAFGQTPTTTQGVATAQIFPPQTVPNQFGAPVSPPSGVILDNVTGEMVNFETLMAKPIVVTPDGQFVLVANDADGRLVVLDPSLNVVAEVPLGQGISAIAARPVPEGQSTQEVWVTLRHQMAVAVIQVSDWSVTHLLRPPIPATVAGARDADSPGGIVFNGNGSRAYVTAFNTDSLNFYDANAKSWLKTLPLEANHNGFPVAMNEPFAIARSGRFLYIASYRSGNGTLAESDQNLPLPQPRNHTKDLDADPTDPRTLPEFDVCVVSTLTEQVVHMIKSVGTTLNGVGVVGGKIWVPNLEARNGEIIGESSFPDGRVAFNRLTVITPTNPTGPHQDVILEDLTPGSNPWTNVVLPHDLASDALGRIYTAGYGSKNIGVFNVSGGFLGTLPAEIGPIGLALSTQTQRLYCYNRASSSVTSYDVSQPTLPTASSLRTDLVDPTWTDVRRGRVVFLDSTHSGKGTTSCASCHQHLRNDGISWDLSKYFDPVGPYSVANAPQHWEDRKGVMQTQSLLSLEEVPPYHWRGEQKDLEDFNGAFVNLLRGSILDPEDFAAFKKFVFSGHYRANPFQMMNRDFSSVAKTGISGFQTFPAVGTETCSDCHDFPTGTDSDITDRFIGANAARATKTAQLRGLWNKTSTLAVLDAATLATHAMTGSGFLHDGTIFNSDHFMDVFFSAHPTHAETGVFLKEFDSGVAPAANYSEFLDASNPTAGQFLVDQAVAGHCGLAVQGVYFRNNQWHTLGWYLETSVNPPVFVPSLTGFPTLTLAGLQGTINTVQGRWLLLGVPPGSERRFGVDRDRDGAFDHDELAAGLDPTDPDSDDDGRWDGEPVSTTAPQVLTWNVEWATTNSVKITYTTDALSPTRLEWGPAGGALTNSEGDAFPLPTGTANTSNLWKRFHTVSIRLTEENTAYDFQIVTQGQNGVTASHPIQTTATLADELSPSMLIQDIALVAVPISGGTRWDATFTIFSDHGAPESGVRIRANFTTFLGGIAVAHQVLDSGTAVTNAQGQLTMSVTVTPAQSTGDGMAVDLPMSVIDPNTGNGTGSPLIKGGVFPKWSESLVRSRKVIL